MELELASEGHQGAHEVGGRAQGGGARPPPSWTGCEPLVFIFGEDFLFRGVSGHSENFCFLHIKLHHGNSAENSVSPGQFHSNHAS